MPKQKTAAGDGAAGTDWDTDAAEAAAAKNNGDPYPTATELPAFEQRSIGEFDLADSGEDAQVVGNIPGIHVDPPKQVTTRSLAVDCVAGVLVAHNVKDSAVIGEAIVGALEKLGRAKIAEQVDEALKQAKA